MRSLVPKSFKATGQSKSAFGPVRTPSTRRSCESCVQRPISKATDQSNEAYHVRAKLCSHLAGDVSNLVSLDIFHAYSIGVVLIQAVSRYS